MAGQRQERESVWSVARKWLPWCLLLIFSLTIGWTAFVSWVEATQFSHESDSQLVIAAVNKSAPTIPLIAVFSMMVVTLGDVLGGGILVTKRYLEEKFLNPWLEKQAEKGRREGREQERKMWEAWYERQQLALAKGESFNEPPPGSVSSNGNG